MHFETAFLLLGIAGAGAAGAGAETVTVTETFVTGNVQSVCACTVATLAPGGDGPGGYPPPGQTLSSSGISASMSKSTHPGQQPPNPSQPGGVPPGNSLSLSGQFPPAPTAPGSAPTYTGPNPLPPGHSSSSNVPGSSAPHSVPPPSHTVPTSKPKSSKMKTKTRTEKPKPSESSPPMCELPWTDPEEAKKSWAESGAENFLLHYLDTHGIENWVDDIFTDTVAGGNQGGPTYNCQSFPNGNCDLPEDAACESYDPKHMFFVHMEIANVYNAFDTIYQELDGKVIEAMGSTITDVQKVFGESGTPKGFWGMMIGAAVVGAGMAGPTWQIAAPFTVMVGVLNVAAAMEETAEEDPDDDLNKAITGIYKGFKDSLSTTVKAIFSGNFDGVKNFDGDKKKFIMDAFREGNFLSFKAKDQAVSSYIEGFHTLLTHCLIFTSLAQNDYVLALHKDVKEKNCKETGEGVGVFMKTPDGDRCAWIGTATTNPADIYGEVYYNALSEDTMKVMEEDYKVDVKAAFRNIIECDGGKPDFSKPPSDKKGDYPKCILPMKAVTKRDD